MENPKIVQASDIVIRISGDSGDGNQLSGSILSSVTAICGNEISTYTKKKSIQRIALGGGF